MIRTVMLWGLLLGASVGHRAHLLPLALLGALVSIAWGLLVAARVSAASFLGGTAIAVPDVAVGAALDFELGAILRSAVHLARGN